MIITYHNIEFFKLQLGDTTIALNPISKESKFKKTRFGADIALISTKDEDFNGIEAVSSKNKETFVIDGPGEYEVLGVFIKGALSKTFYREKERINIIYSLIFDGITLGFLGALGNKDLNENTKSILGDIDILFVPIGGEGTLGATEAHNLATKLGAKIIIPMHYGDVGEKDSLKTFLEEGGLDDIQPIDRLTVKKKDLDDIVGKIIVLNSVS